MHEQAPFQPLQVVVGFVLHLAMQNLDAIETHFGGQVDTGLDIPQGSIAKLPEGVRGNDDTIGSLNDGLVRAQAGSGGRQGQRSGRPRQKITTIHSFAP